MFEAAIGLATALPTGIDPVFVAFGKADGAGARRTIGFAPGQPIPRVGAREIIAFDARPVLDVSHVFEADGHGIAIELAAPAD